MGETVRKALESWIGKRADDEGLLAFLKQHKLKPPKSTTDNENTAYVVAKKLGFELVFEHRIRHRAYWPPKKENRRYVSYLAGAFLEPALAEDIPKSREALAAAATQPVRTNSFGDEQFELQTRSGLTLTVTWRPENAAVWRIFLGLEKAREFLSGGRHPPHAFGSRPKDIGEGQAGDAAETFPALFSAWAILRLEPGSRHEGSPWLERLRRREITPLVFFREALGEVLWNDDVSAPASDFVEAYVRRFVNDAIEVFKGTVPSPYHVPDSWEAFDRLAPWLDARLAHWRQGGLESAPPPGLYETARAEVDAKPVTRTAVAPTGKPAAAPSGDLAARLVSLLGKPSSDPHVKALTKEFGLSDGYGKGAAPTQGFEIGFISKLPDWYPVSADATAKKKKTFNSVTFYAEGETSVVGGHYVTFGGYAGPLPFGLVFGGTVGEARSTLGDPRSVDREGQARWNFEAQKYALTAQFNEGRLRRANVFIPGSFR